LPWLLGQHYSKQVHSSLLPHCPRGQGKQGKFFNEEYLQTYALFEAKASLHFQMFATMAFAD
jgi:hypothetical protein